MAERKPKEALTSADLVHRLRERHPAPTWAFFSELRGGTGFSREGRADAIAMGLWPSRGMEIHGFEVKVSRSDWRRELENPAKAEQLQQFCDRWWVVVGDESIVQAGELPPTWGLMVPHGTGLRARTEAPRLEAVPLDRPFVAALLRRSADADVVKLAEDAAVQQARKRWDAERERWRETDESVAQRELALLKKGIAEFEAASGLKFAPWEAGKVGAAVALVREGRDHLETLAGDLRRFSARQRELADEAAELLKQVEAERAAPVEEVAHA